MVVVESDSVGVGVCSSEEGVLLSFDDVSGGDESDPSLLLDGTGSSSVTLVVTGSSVGSIDDIVCYG